MHPIELVAAGVLLAAAPLATQSDPRLARAITIEESEHRPEAALALYTEIARDEAAPAAVRTRAELRAARAARALGDEEAADAALRRAAAGSGPAAERARALLQDPQQDPAAGIEQRVRQLVVRLRQQDDEESARRLIAEIGFYGDRALPVVGRAIQDEAGDMPYVEHLASVIWQTGGAAAKELLDELRGVDEPLKRRAVVAGVERGIAGGLSPALTAFLDDPDPLVRVEALEVGRGEAARHPVDEVLALLDDTDPRVRDAAVSYLTRTPGLDRLEGTPLDKARSVWQALRSSDRPDPWQRQVLLVRALEGELFETPDGRAMVLQLIDLPTATGQWRRRGQVVEETVQPDELAAELAAVAHHVHERGGNPNVGPGSVIQWLVDGLHPRWTASSVDEALSLAELGYSISWDWWRERADAAAWRRMLVEPDVFGLVLFSQAAHGLRGEPLEQETLAAPRDWFESTLQQGVAGESTSDVASALQQVGYLLAMQPGADAGAWALHQIRRLDEAGSAPALQRDHGERDELRWMLFAGMAQQTTAKRLEQVRELAVDPDLGDAALRNYALGWLVHQGAPELTELMRAALPLPLHGLGGGPDQGVVRRELPELATGSLRPTGLRWLGVDDFHPLSEPQVRGIIAGVVESGTAACWEAAYGVRRSMSPTTTRSQLQGPGESRLRNALILHWTKAPDPRPVQDVINSRGHDFSDWDGPPPDEVLLAALRFYFAQATDPQTQLIPSWQSECFRFLQNAVESAPEIRQHPFVVSKLEELIDLDGPPVDFLSERLRAQAVYNLYRIAPERREELVERIGLEDDSFRYYVYGQRLGEPGADRTELVKEMLADPYSSIRRQACEVAAELKNRELVEPLIAALRDESEQVRDKAREALEATRYYLEQQAVFRRLLDESGLGNPATAAEALLRQVRDDANDTAIRVAAIRSLGTLGVPESLPFLIELMKSDDAALRQAAAAAVERINATAGKGGDEGQPPGDDGR